MATTLNTIALDLGTTAIKAAICNNRSQIEETFSIPAPTISAEQGHYVSNAMEYLSIAGQLLKKCQNICQKKQLLGICYQRSSFLVWNSTSGLPVTKLISWQDDSGQASCIELIKHNPLIRELSGLPLTPYYFAPKLRTLLQQQPELWPSIANKTLLIGTLDSFIIWHWTARRHFLTDTSMAARTLLMDIHSGQWSKTLGDIFAIPIKILPKIQPSTNLNLALNHDTILKVSIADQSAALLANVTFTNNDESEILVNLGTGGFVSRSEPKQSNKTIDNYLRTLVYQDHQRNQIIAIEGTINSITAALQLYPFQTCKIKDLANIADIFCIAEPTGIGAPFFRSDIKMQFSKPVEHLSKEQIACLLLEAIIFRVALILEDFNQRPDKTRIYLSGGLSNSSCLQQGIANCSTSPVFKVLQRQSSLQGTAILINNLAPTTYRQSEAVIKTKHKPLVEKYQQWKIWFKNFGFLSPPI
jgi:glycerol kinase